MPSGDSGRAWFPEMLVKLKATWSKKWAEDISWDEIIIFCKKMTEFRQQLRKQKGVKYPIMWCPECNDYREMELSSISPRSMLFALKKNDVIDDETLKTLDKQWAAYKRKHKLDGYGEPKTT